MEPTRPLNERPVLLFDVMGTLVHDPFYREVPAHLGLSLEELLRDKHPTAWVEFEHGRIDEAHYLRHVFRDGRAIDGAALVACMRDAYRWLEGIEPILTELAARGHAMHAFSNYPSLYERIEERLGLSRFMAWTFVSCKTGFRKPDQEAYRHVCRTLQCAPQQCLFVDDRAVNCAAARAVGMQALEFADAARLRADLSARGWL